MVKLRTLRDGTRKLGYVGQFLDRSRAQVSRERDASVEWRSWYKTARWQRKRWSVLVRDDFTCQRCGRVEAITSKLVADHKIPHRGDEALFWDDDNLQCLCKTCHDSAKQREEAAARR